MSEHLKANIPGAEYLVGGKALAMNLRPNYFGLAVNSGLSIFIAVVLFRSSSNLLGGLFLAIALVHFMRLRRVSVSPDRIVVKYPFVPFLQDKFIPNRSLVSFRFASGYYTDWNAVILGYKNEKGMRSIRIPVSPFDREELEKNLATWYATSLAPATRPGPTIK